MDPKVEIREFLATRRAKITPEQAGLPDYGGSRRVPGLRREEVAMLAGVSVDYYVRLERGNVAGASEAVLESIARALQLDEAERGHLFDLARAASAAGRQRRRPAPIRVRPGVQQLLRAITDAPAWVRNGRMDYLAGNRLARALYSDLLASPARPVNIARFLFLDPRSRDFYIDWDTGADDVVAILRAEAGRTPFDPDLTELIGELSTRSEEFTTRWAAHNVRYHRTGVKRLHHGVVGDLELDYEALEFPGEPGLRMFVYTAAPGSPSADALTLLASWAATQDQLESAQPAADAEPAAHER
jgi:transcriptional regulator with XRE-family HTH domain